MKAIVTKDLAEVRAAADKPAKELSALKQTNAALLIKLAGLETRVKNAGL